jgi:large subunit ribosomal protein L27
MSASIKSANCNFAGELVVPGVIIYRQRGTKWFPGENCDMGRDHTIHATVKGYVRYYRDPQKHPKRRYIGVVFEKHMTLPTPLNAPRRRRLNMVATQQKDNEDGLRVGGPFTPVIPAVEGTNKYGRFLKMQKDYSFKVPTYELGKAAEEAGVKVRPYDHGDRWIAWRKRQRAKKVATEKKRLASLAKKGKKDKKGKARKK